MDIRKKTLDIINNTKNEINKYTANTDLFTQIIILITGLIIFLLILWGIRMINLQKNLLNCNDLNKLYKKQNTFISSFAPNGAITHTDYGYLLYDYYIKTAHNACSGGEPTNSFVSACALETCIKQGYRCLDFEVYSVNKIPVISTSSENDFRLKETYNYIELDKAMQIISSFAFSSVCPNNFDPLLLHFRIMTNHKDILDKMASSIVNHLSSRLLNPEYGFENHGINLGSNELKNFIGKIIIIVDKSNPIYVDTKLDELVNITSNSIFMRSYRNSQLSAGNFTKELIDYNKENMTIILPPLSRNYNNFNPNLALNQGCQLIAMNMQNYDVNLEYYNKLFNENNSAFVLKPVSLRGEPPIIVTIDPPDPVLKQEEKTSVLPTGHTVTF